MVTVFTCKLPDHVVDEIRKKSKHLSKKFQRKVTISEIVMKALVNQLGIESPVEDFEFASKSRNTKNRKEKCMNKKIS